MNSFCAKANRKKTFILKRLIFLFVLFLQSQFLLLSHSAFAGFSLPWEILLIVILRVHMSSRCRQAMSSQRVHSPSLLRVAIFRQLIIYFRSATIQIVMIKWLLSLSWAILRFKSASLAKLISRIRFISLIIIIGIIGNPIICKPLSK